MTLYKITFEGAGFETYEIEADSEAEAIEACHFEWPQDTRVEGAEFLAAEEIEDAGA